MRPLKLTMTAFGPYKDTEVVNFAELEEHDLFVISGKTGAGKTTIFDGICFALYGSASGQDRGETKMLRSDFASDDVHTAVELEFELKGKQYRIRRQLGHVKKGNRSKTGDDIFIYERQGEEEISIVDRQIVSEVNQKVEDLIGLTNDQFKQIVMLPQGEFRKLLTSDTENKEAILRRLFKTENYKSINEVLRNKRNEEQLEYEKQLQIRNEYIHSIPSFIKLREESLLIDLLETDFPNAHQVAAALEDEAEYYEERIKNDEETYKKSYELTNKMQKEYHEAQHLNERFQELEKKQQTLNELYQRNNEFEEKEVKLLAAERANSLLFYERQLEQAKQEEKQVENELQLVTNQLSKATNVLEHAKSSYLNEEKRKPEREKAGKELDELEKYLPIVRSIEETKLDIERIKEKGIKTKQKLATIEKQLLGSEEKQQFLRTEISKLDEEIDKLSDAPTRLMKLEEQARIYKRYENLAKESEQAQQVVATITKSYNELKEDYREKEASWLSNQAVVLAGHLHNGEPCPVCGSVEHPKIATSKEQAVSREELQHTKLLLDKKEKEFQEANIILQAKKSQLAEVKEEIKAFTDGENLEQFYTRLIDEGKSMRNKVQCYERLREERKAKKQEEEKILEEKRNLDPIFNKLKDEHVMLQQDYKTKRAVLEERLRNIPESLTVLEELEKQIRLVTEKKQSLEKAWEDAQLQLEKARESFTKTDANKTHLEKQLSSIKTKVTEAKDKFKTKLSEENFVDEAAYYAAKLPEEKQQLLKSEIDAFKQQLAILTKQTDELKESLKGKQPKDLNALKQELDQLQKQYEEAFKQLNEARDYQERAQSRKIQILKADEELKKKEQLVSAVSDVYDMLRGQNSKKISFERFLQMEYLEQIIHAANSRLQKLSNNQYYLTRSDRQESHGKQSGLALDVYDNHTGQTRDVKTLSGGEKFNAALSLALGMSDVIQSFQGNISIETMFIDEGFGSLDEEALTKAVDALVDLMESGRMIGVISHVKELKEIFPAILEVRKTKEGYSETAFVLK